MTRVTQTEPTLRERRERTGRTIDEVAAGIGVTPRTYRRWENGEKLPDAENLIRLADYYRIHPRKLVPSSDPQPDPAPAAAAGKER